MDQLIDCCEVELAGIPALALAPRAADSRLPVALYYHGWRGSAAYKRFTGQILAACGFLVVLPDAPHHGRRGTLDYDREEVFGEYFWPIVLQAVAEAPALLSAAARLQLADPERLGVLGVSMGGMIASGVFAGQPRARCLVNINGACDWVLAAESFARDKTASRPDKSLMARVRAANPAADLSRWVPRPVLLLHGEADSSVPLILQRQFTERAAPAYQANPHHLQLTAFPKLDHHTTVNMLELAAGWLARHLRREIT